VPQPLSAETFVMAQFIKRGEAMFQQSPATTD
jgi:hypothetical protein